MSERRFAFFREICRNDDTPLAKSESASRTCTYCTRNSEVVVLLLLARKAHGCHHALRLAVNAKRNDRISGNFTKFVV